MHRILRDPGAEVLVGFLSFAVSFVAIGLAIAALDEDNERLWLLIVPFIIAAILFICAVVAAVYLIQYLTKIRRCEKQIAAYMRRAYKLRAEIHAQWQSALRQSVEQWVSEVQDWLDNNLPDQAPDFGLEVTNVTDLISTGLSDEANEASLLVESKVSTLREILREVRR